MIHWYNLLISRSWKIKLKAYYIATQTKLLSLALVMYYTLEIFIINLAFTQLISYGPEINIRCMQDSSHHSPVVEQEDTMQSHLLAWCQSKHVQQLLSCKAQTAANVSAECLIPSNQEVMNIKRK